MTSFLRLFLFVLVISGVLFFSNPEKKDFVAWATLKLYSYGNQQAGAIGAGIAGLIGGPILNKTISRENYYLFSTFTIDNPIVAKAVTESAEDIGKTTMVGFLSPFFYFPISQGTKDFLQTLSFSKNSVKPSVVNTNTNTNANTVYSKYIGKYPSEFLSDIKNQDTLRSIVTNNNDELNKIKSYFDVATPIIKDGKFIVGQGCKARECSDFNGIFILNTDNNNFVLISYEDKKGIVIFNSDEDESLKIVNGGGLVIYDFPNSAKKWLNERNIPFSSYP